MDDLKFVLRSLFFATLIILLSQIKFGDEKLETKAEFFLNKSEVGHFLHKSAEGGAKFMADVYSSAKDYIQSKFSSRSTSQPASSRSAATVSTVSKAPK